MAFDQLATAKRQNRGTPLPQISLDQICAMPGQPRQFMDPEALQELADSIKNYGVIQPIIVVARRDAAPDDPVRYQLVAGERRWRASRLAGLDSVPAIVRDYEPDEAAVLALLENLQRADLTPLEEAEYLMQLKQKHGWTEEGLGERLGKSRDYIHMRTRLLNLAPDLLATWREACVAGVFETMTPSHAILVNQVGDPALRGTLTAAIMAGGVTVAETRKRLELVKQLDAEGGDLDEGDLVTLKTAAYGGTPKGEVLMRLGARKQRGGPAVVTGEGPGPQLALADLATHGLFQLLARAESQTVSLRELETALKQDLAWVKKIGRDGLANG